MIKVDLDTSALNTRLKKQQQALAKLPDQGLDKFRSLTPIKTGNARANTDLTNNNKKITGNYPYAQRLEDNWSTQTKGQGIIKPFTQWWVNQLKNIARMK